MTYRLRNIFVAVALALVAALLTGFYVTNYQRNVRKDETNVPDISFRWRPGRRGARGRPASDHSRQAER